jgi:peptidylprolyl isomerase
MMLAGALLALPLLGAIAPGTAFDLPSSKKTCVSERTLFVDVKPLRTATWTKVTVKVDGKRVKRVKRPRTFKVRALPEKPFTFKLAATTDDGRKATATRHYTPCPSPKPVVTVPDGAPPSKLTVTDLIVGTGPTPKRGHTISVMYTGNAWSTKEEFDSSWPRHEPFSFAFKAGQVIKGFDRGIAGMRVGGRRQVTIPPDLGYGSEGVGSVIGPDETLVFVIDLVAVG